MTAWLHVVERRHWERDEFDRPYCPDDSSDEPIGGQILAVCRHRERAEELRDAHEYEHRSHLDPLSFSGPIDGLPQDEFELRQRIIDAGIPTIIDGPPDDPTEWPAWWRGTFSELTPNDAMLLWDRLGGGKFYALVTIELVGEVQVERKFIVRRTRNRDFGRAIRAFGNRADAETYAAQLKRHDSLNRNPFDYLSPGQAASSLDGPRLHDWLLDCGFPTPPLESAELQAWRQYWTESASELAAWQLARAWSVMDRVVLFDVIDSEVDESTGSSYLV